MVEVVWPNPGTPTNTPTPRDRFPYKLKKRDAI